MKYIKFITVILIIASSCKKADTLPKLSFSKEERNWLIYQVGQSFKFKSSNGDSIVFIVDSVRNYFKPEYKDPLNNPVKIGEAEFYVAYMRAADDFINIAFYKEFLYDRDKLKNTILWLDVIGQFVEIDNIKIQTRFISKTINGKTYNKVSAATPLSDMVYSWTQWESAYYDQEYGFIELIDKNGISWLRQ